MSRTVLDAIVIGIGGMGSSTILELASRKVKVLGIEQFPLVHNQGSSHGQTRIIRTAYYEHPDYVPLVKRSFTKWREIESQCPAQLLTDCDCLSIGLPESEIIQGVYRAAKEHSLPVESLDHTMLSKRFPMFQFAPEYRGILEHQSGYLAVEKCVRSQIELAIRYGAEVHSSEKLIRFEFQNGEIGVWTDKGEYRSKYLLLCQGPWATEIPGLSLPLKVMRQVMHWFSPIIPEQFQRDRFPIFMADLPEGAFYGLPMVDHRGIKIARHYGEIMLENPSQIDRTVSEADRLPLIHFLQKHLPEANGNYVENQSCIYTLTPDRHFLLDRHPDCDQILIAAGFSGHGFKFSPVIGEILADWVTQGKTEHPVRLFSLKRGS